MSQATAIVACAAIARELTAVLAANNLQDRVSLLCLPADLHNRPDQIADAVAGKIGEIESRFDQIIVGYGDCGTGGALDRMLDKRGIKRLSGDHCYEFLQAPGAFREQLDEVPGTFFLTDFLVRHFQRLVVQGLGLDRFPELRDDYFGHYQRVLYLAQSDDVELKRRAGECADYLNLELEYRLVGLAPLATDIQEKVLIWQD